MLGAIGARVSTETKKKPCNSLLCREATFFVILRIHKTFGAHQRPSDASKQPSSCALLGIRVHVISKRLQSRLPDIWQWSGFMSQSSTMTTLASARAKVNRRALSKIQGTYSPIYQHLKGSDWPGFSKIFHFQICTTATNVLYTDLFDGKISTKMTWNSSTCEICLLFPIYLFIQSFNLLV